MDILNLSHWHVEACEESEDRYVFHSAMISPRISCPSCGMATLVKHGTDAQVLRDLPMHGKHVFIHIDHQRYRCIKCRKTCYQPLPEIDPKRFMTKRLVAYIERKTLSTNRTFCTIAEEISIDPRTVRNIFDDVVAALSQTVTFETPTILGIDELHVLGAPRCVFTNLDVHTILELTEDRKKNTVMSTLRHLKKPECVRTVVIDLWRPYKEAVLSVLPDAVIVADKFHVLKLATTALETFRKQISAQLSDTQRKTLKMHDRYLLLRRKRDLTPEQLFLLETWTQNYPLLGQAHQLKEQFFEIYDHQTLKDAHDAYLRWMRSVPVELLHVYLPLMLTIEEWGEYIFAHFEQNYITGGFVESANNVARCLNRIGRGYSLPVLRGRLLYGMRGRADDNQNNEHQTDGGNSVDLVSLGVPISTLIGQH